MEGVQAESTLQDLTEKTCISRASTEATEISDTDHVLQQREASAAVRPFLDENGFIGVNAKLTRQPVTSCPLHAAVAKGDAKTVEVLLRAKANPLLRNGSGLTPQQLAQMRNVDGSHAAMISLLVGKVASSASGGESREMGPTLSGS